MPASNQCITCAHYWGDSKCDAFPDGIPEDIITGIFDHAVTWPGQENDIVREEGDPFALPEGA